MKKIQIKTIEDIINKIPEDRLDYFLKDLESYIKYSYKIKDMLSSFPKGAIEKNMTWIDDGKNDFKGVNLEIK